jgi:hypothetical protein
MEVQVEEEQLIKAQRQILVALEILRPHRHHKEAMEVKEVNL